MMERIERRIRALLLSLASNVGLYALASFLFMGVLITSPLRWVQDQVQNYFSFILIPWGMALCLLRLIRRQQLAGPVGADVRVLFVLLVWIVVPFAYRFGLTYNNINSWCGYAIVFFGIYALLREDTPERRGRMLDWAGGAFCVFSLLYGAALLYCAVTVQTFAADQGDYGFGFYKNMFLCGGIHYNTTAMVALSALFMALSGAARRRHAPAKLVHLLAALMMAAVVVLTQSRTARYAMIAALSAGALSVAAGRIRARLPMRLLGGLLAAALTAVICYAGTSLLSDAALEHYMRVENKRAGVAMEQPEEGGLPKLTAVAAAEEESAPQAAPTPEAEPTPEPTATPLELTARKATDTSFNGRMTIWKGLFAFFKSNPKSLVIGNGVGRTGSIVVENISWRQLDGITMHNTYLQFIADFGLVGLALMCLFFLTILMPCLRAFFAAGRRPDGRLSMGMAVVAILITGLMESAPLGELTSMNVVLFFALGILAAPQEEEAPAL